MYWKSLSRSHAKSCQKTTATVAHTMVYCQLKDIAKIGRIMPKNTMKFKKKHIKLECMDGM